MDNTISSKRAAGLLKVNESTIKRWADNGTLKCFRTPGGHRKFRLSDITSLNNKYNFDYSVLNYADNDLKLKFSMNLRNSGEISSRLEKMILKGETGNAYILLYTLYLNNFSLEEIFDNIVGKAMRRIGEKWEAKMLGIENEHIATNTVISALHLFNRELKFKNVKSKTAICSGLENEFHEIGLLCVKITLESLGWKVIYTGINLPVDSLLQLVKKEKPKIVCISEMYNLPLKKSGAYINYLLDNLKNLNCRLIIGGENKYGAENSGIYCKSIESLKNELINIK
jgi:excisionase family DNA binding protein